MKRCPTSIGVSAASACETACPSGVRYRELVVPFRAHMQHKAESTQARLMRQLLLTTLESPDRFRLAARLGQAARRMSGLLPPSMRVLLELLPPGLPASDRTAEVHSGQRPAARSRGAADRLRAACPAAVDQCRIGQAVLAANGVEIVIPPEQGCCGALAQPYRPRRSRRRARRAQPPACFPRDIDAIMTTAAGCGSAMQDDGALPAPARDVAEFLDHLGLRTPLALRATRSWRIRTPAIWRTDRAFAPRRDACSGRCKD